jgi:ABC-type multidrug transport system permease subunit
MKEFLAIFIARNIEFYRDRAALSWSFIFPLLIILGCVFAFSKPDDSVFKVGLVGEVQSQWLQERYLQTVPYQQLDKALERIQHHQLDVLIQATQPPIYWINPQSQRSIAAEQLLLASHSDWQPQQLSGKAVRYVDWVMPGVLGMNMMFGALFGAGYVIVRYRRNGVLKRLQATPITALQFLSAQMTSRLLIVATVNAIIFIGCYLTLDLLVLGSLLDLLLILILGSLSMIAMGLLISSRTANEELAGGLLNAGSWPMMFLSDVWFSLDDAPEWMIWMADWLPLTHIVKAARAVMVEGASLGDISHHLVWLAGMTTVFIVLAAWLFRWNKG